MTCTCKIYLMTLFFSLPSLGWDTSIIWHWCGCI